MTKYTRVNPGFIPIGPIVDQEMDILATKRRMHTSVSEIETLLHQAMVAIHEVKYAQELDAPSRAMREAVQGLNQAMLALVQCCSDEHSPLARVEQAEHRLRMLKTLQSQR